MASSVIALLTLGWMGLITLSSTRVSAQSNCVNCPAYVALSAQQKQDLLFSKASSGAITSNFPSSYPSALALYTLDMDSSFDRFSDEFPQYRTRAIHGPSALAKVRYEVTANTL